MALNQLVDRTDLPRWSGAPTRDPFRSANISDQAGAVTVVPAAKKLALSSILQQTGSSVAVINRQLVGEGETIEGYMIEKIDTDRVWVTGSNGLESVGFKSDLSRTNDRLGRFWRSQFPMPIRNDIHWQPDAGSPAGGPAFVRLKSTISTQPEISARNLSPKANMKTETAIPILQSSALAAPVGLIILALTALPASAQSGMSRLNQLFKPRKYHESAPESLVAVQTPLPAPAPEPIEQAPTPAPTVETPSAAMVETPSAPAAAPGMVAPGNGKTVYKFRADNEDFIRMALAELACANDLNIVPDNNVTGIVTLDVYAICRWRI